MGYSLCVQQTIAASRRPNDERRRELKATTTPGAMIPAARRHPSIHDHQSASQLYASHSALLMHVVLEEEENLEMHRLVPSRLCRSLNGWADDDDGDH